MKEILQGNIYYDIPLVKFTSWRIGGAVPCLYQPKNKEDLQQFVKLHSSMTDFFWIGLGSNLLIRDGGLSETVIHPLEGLNHLEQLDSCLVRAEAGVGCAQAARFCARLSLEGAEFLAGIPGTIGGALAMNAGCFSSETWELVQQVEVINKKGEIIIRPPSDFKISYREVIGREHEWFVAAYFQLHNGKKENSLAKIRTLLDKRAATQPTGEHNCGSVFRNPPGDYAGRLIEAAGLKGARIGGAHVSEKHANFIINDGSATASDIESLISQVEQEVRLRHGITLKKEVKIVGKSI